MAAVSKANIYVHVKNHRGLAEKGELDGLGIGTELKRRDRKGRRNGNRSSKKVRPASMISAPAYSSAQPSRSGGGRVSSSIATAIGRGFNLANPKALFSKDRHHAGRMEGCNSKVVEASRGKMIQMRPIASQVR